MRELTYTNSRKCMLPKDYTKSSKFLERNYAVFAALFASLAAFCIGTCIAWSSAAIHLHIRDTFPLEFPNMTTRHVSWIISGFCLGATLSTLFVYKIWRFVGSKRLILTACGFLLMSWISLSIYQDRGAVLAARILAGISVGCLHFLVPIYIQDIASSDLKITVDFMWSSFLAAGILAEYSAVLLKNFQLINILSGVSPAVLFVGFFFMPESPRYLCYKGQSNAAKDILRKFREIGDDIDQDIHSWCNKKTENFAFKNVIRGPCSFRRTLTAMGLVVFDQLCGGIGCFFYLSWNFRILDGELSPELSSIIIAALFFVGILLPKLLGITFGDKLTLIWTLLLQAATLLLLGFYVHYRGSYNEIEEEYYLSLTCYGVYVLLYGMGLNRISWKYIRHLVPRSRYFVTMNVCTALSWFVLVFFTRGYANFIEFVGIGWLFWFMALSCLGLVIFTAIAVPSQDKLESKSELDEEAYVPPEHDSN